MTQQILSQEEVDALLEGMSGDTRPEADDAAGGTVRVYDLASQERIVRGRMPTLEIVNERFARNLRIGLFNFMRRTPDIAVGPVKVQKYSAFLRNVLVPTNINLVQLQPLRGSGLVICDPTLVFTVIDNLFGGSGRHHTQIEGRDFSPTEQRIILRLFEVVAGDWHKAWTGIYPLRFEYVRSEMNPQFATIATPSEIVVTTTFTIQIGDVASSMHICMPYSVLEPIRDILYSTLQSEQMETDQRWVSQLTQQIQGAEVDLVAELANVPLTVADLLELRAGDFIALDAEPTLPVTVDGVPVFDCGWGTSGGRYAIRIERFNQQPTSPAGGRADHGTHPHVHR